MNNQATFDPSRELDLYFRIGRNGSKSFVFTDSDSNPYSFIYREIELNIYYNSGDRDPIITLSPSISINIVTFNITTLLSSINEGEYYWELYRPDLEKTWLSGSAFFHNGKFDGVNNDSSTILVDDGSDVTITINDNSLYITKEVPIVTFATSLKFDEDEESFHTGGTHSFTLQSSGNINGIGKIIKLNTPVSASFTSDFILMEGSDSSVSASKLNIIVMRYFSNYDGAGTPRVLYRIIQQTSV